MQGKEYRTKYTELFQITCAKVFTQPAMFMVAGSMLRIMNAVVGFRGILFLGHDSIIPQEAY